jgi:soluble lytic murein transglycosylase
MAPEGEAAPRFEAALESPNPYIRLAAAEELALPLLRQKTAAEAFLEGRYKAGSKAPVPLRPLIAAALYGLDRWGEIPALHGPEGGEIPAGRAGGTGATADGGPLRETMASWDRALLLMARLRAGEAAPAKDTGAGVEEAAGGKAALPGAVLPGAAFRVAALPEAAGVPARLNSQVWAHFLRPVGPQKTGLSAPIFAPPGQKFRSYPLRGPKPLRGFGFGLAEFCFAKLRTWVRGAGFALGVSRSETPGNALRGAGKGRLPGNPPAAVDGTAGAGREALFAYLFDASPGPALVWIAGELQYRPGILSEAQASALEGRLATARSSFRQGLDLFRPALEEEPGLFLQYPALIDDLGRCFQFGSPGTEGLELFLEWERRAPSPSLRYRLLYHAGRIARARGLYGRGAGIFEEALARAPDKSQEDSCIWYILDALLRDGELSGAELLDLVKTWAPRWNDPSYFSDILDRIAQRLAASGQWRRFPEFLALLEQDGDPLSNAKYAYISGRALMLGLIPPENGAEGENGARRFFRAAYNTGARALYYRALAARFLGEPFLPPEEEAPAGGRGFPQSGGLDFLRGFFTEGAAGFAAPYVEALAGELGLEELRALAEAMEKAGAYPEQIRLVSAYMGRGDYSFRRRDLELLSPRPFRELIEGRAGEAGLAAELFYGLIRTESAFQPEIASRVGALGLTQLMPATAADMAGRIKRQGGPDYTGNLDLGDPEINTAIGAYYLNYLQDLLDHPLLSILAYNGGLSRVRRWRRAQPALPGDLFLETVEYPETREYGRKVISAAALYGYLYYGVNPPPLLADICK